MRKLFLLFLIISAGVQIMAQAQRPNDGKNRKKGNFLYAAVVGLNYAGLTGSPYGEKYQYIFGGQVGFIVKVADLNKAISLRAEVNGSMQGAKFPVSFSSSQSDQATAYNHLTYLNLPIVLRYQSKCGFFGEAGVQPGLLVAARQKVLTYNNDIRHQANSFDFGIPFGLGYEFKNHMGAGVRCVPGLRNYYQSGSIITRHNLVTALRVSYTI